MASTGYTRASVRIRQPGRVRLGGHYTLVILEHPGSGSDSPIKSDQEGVLHFSGIRAS